MLEGGQPSLSWPQVFVHLSSIQVGTQGEHTAYAPKVLARQGITISADDNEKEVYNVSIVPAAFTFEVTYVNDDFMKALDFAAGWVWHSIRNSYNFTVNYGSLPIDIKITADEQISTPDRDESVGHPNMYEYTANMVVLGYISGKGQDGIRIIPVLNQEQSTMTIDPTTVAAVTPPITIPL